MNNFQKVLAIKQLDFLIIYHEAMQKKLVYDSFSEIVLFLARYSFLFENPQNSINSCTSEVMQIYTEQAFSDWSMKFTDPDGCEQTSAQKFFTSCLSTASKISPRAQAFIKANTSIDIQRSSQDKGQNGNYFKSQECVKFCGIPLNSIDVQSTADYKTEVDAGRGRTINAGSYTGTLLNKSGSYNEAISISGNGVAESEAILCHPNAKTAKGATVEYANGERPYSAGCQISHLEDFNEVTDILKDLGFEYGKGQDAWAKGDTIKINIKPPVTE